MDVTVPTSAVFWVQRFYKAGSLKPCEFDAQGNSLASINMHSTETVNSQPVFTKLDSMAGNFLSCSILPCPYPQSFPSLLYPEKEINQNVD